ncbi:MAG: cyclic pyranopterin monophosphate synthase MoaC, partial [Pseudolysinimonas sp.]
MSEHGSSELSHLDHEGRARMIDVGGKAITRRVATAGGRLDTTAEVVALVMSDGLKKADALATARVAGISAAKRTSELIPLAHLLPLDSVTIEFEPGESSIGITATVAVTAKTGVEMEALTAVAIAGLTLHDMIKAVDPSAVLGDIRLLSKTGGKSGHWTPALHSHPEAGSAGSAIVIVSSTGAAAGTREDRTGPLLVEWLTAHGYTVGAPVVVADASIDDAVRDAVALAPAVLLTTGGTGIHPQDRTPEATRA